MKLPLTTLHSPPPAPPNFQATPRRLSSEDISPPRVAFEPQPSSYCPPWSPIAHRTRAHINTPPVAPLSFAGICQASFSITPQSAAGFAYLCMALITLDSPAALSVLDPATGEFLEHRQLRQDPRFKAKWDTSYANELGCLCQGIGSGATKTFQ
jgi:hypothetical protein